MTRLLVAALGPDIPLIIKVGAFDDDALLERVLLAAAGAGARGVAGINGLSRCVGVSSWVVISGRGKAAGGAYEQRPAACSTVPSCLLL